VRQAGAGALLSAPTLAAIGETKKIMTQAKLAEFLA
jgi:hypothetical protein